MFDGLRNDASDTSGFDDRPVEFFPDDKPTPKKSRKSGRSTQFLGLTPQQRFILALMLMFAVCSLGAMCLLITEKFTF